MKIAVLGANYQYLSFYKQAKALGYEIISFGREEDDHVCSELADKFYNISFTEKEQILKICKQEGVDGVTSFLIESALPYVYYISRGLGIPCNSKECESLIRDKLTMRERMKEMNISIPAYAVVHSKVDNYNILFPVVVKPADSGGSRGVTLVYERGQLEIAIERALEWSPSKTVMLEQFVGGREFSIEAISFEGKHYIVQITDKVTTGSPYFVELAHHQPADLTIRQWDDIKELTISVLDVLKVEYGASHTEIKLDDDGVPYVIEMGARMGGDFIQSDLVKLSTGYDLVGGVLEVATGRFHAPIADKSKYSGVYFLCEETKDRVLPYIENFDKYSFIVDAAIYGNIKRVQCNSDRSGFFIYQSENRILI